MSSAWRRLVEYLVCANSSQRVNDFSSSNVMVVRLLLWRSVKASLIYCIPKQVCKFALAIVIKVRGFNWLFRLIKRRKFFISSFFFEEK